MALAKFPFIAVNSIELIFIFVAWVLACVADSKQHSWFNNLGSISDPTISAFVGNGIPDLYTFNVFTGAFGTVTIIGLTIWTFFEGVSVPAFLVTYFINWVLFFAGFIQLVTADLPGNCDIVSSAGGDLNKAFCTLPKAVEAFFIIVWVLLLFGFIARWVLPDSAETGPTTETSENPTAEPKTV